jgi:ankyrin repeat protein
MARQGVDFGTANKAGHTAVHKAAWYGKEAVMRFLIAPRCLGGLGLWHCLGLRDVNGLTCWQLAAAASFPGHERWAGELYQAWERGLRRELAERESTWPRMPPVMPTWLDVC